MAANCTTTSSIYSNATKTLLYCTVIIACFTTQLLSVNAIRCHQCNSHIDEDCRELRLSTPRGQRDDHFLKECDKELGEHAFCRKTVLNIDVNGEQRIVRSCGWLRENSGVGIDSCFTADNEGYKQMICTCSEDGCNGSSGHYISRWWVLALAAVSLTSVTVLRRI